MSKLRIASNGLIVCGLLCVAVACWWLHPAVGMLFVGAALLVIGFSVGLGSIEKADSQ